MRGARSARDDRWYRTPPSQSGVRSGSTATWSWVRLLEGGGLADQPAEPRVDDLELEQKASGAELGMRDAQAPGREPRGKAQTKAGELHKVVRGAEDQRGLFLRWRMSFSENRFPLFRDMRRLHVNGQRHADAPSDVF